VTYRHLVGQFLQLELLEFQEFASACLSVQCVTFGWLAVVLARFKTLGAALERGIAPRFYFLVHLAPTTVTGVCTNLIAEFRLFFVEIFVSPATLAYP